MLTSWFRVLQAAGAVSSSSSSACAPPQAAPTTARTTAFPTLAPGLAAFLRMHRARVAAAETAWLRAQRYELRDTPRHRLYATLAYAWRVLRCGVLVRITGGRVSTFLPFANPMFKNAWGEHLRFVVGNDRSSFLNFGAYTARKQAHAGTKRYAPLPPERWWVNGTVACNMPSPQVWGQSFLAEFHSMLSAAVAAHPVPDCVFLLNKRDAPQFRFDRRHSTQSLPAAAHAASLRHRRLAPLLPCFSCYTGDGWADIPLPTPLSWSAGGDLAASLASVAAAGMSAWPARDRRLVFRGSTTGGGITKAANQRLLLLDLVRKAPVPWVLSGVTLDVGFTAINRRDHILPGGIVAFNDSTYATETAAETAAAETAAAETRHRCFDAPFVSLATQAAARYLLYVDGHSASNRFLSQLATGSAVLRVLPARPDVASHLWCHPALACGAINDPASWAAATHWRVSADFATLGATLAFCEAHPAVVAAAAARGQAAAQTLLRRTTMARYVAAALRSGAP